MNNGVPPPDPVAAAPAPAHAASPPLALARLFLEKLGAWAKSGQKLSFRLPDEPVGEEPPAARDLRAFIVQQIGTRLRWCRAHRDSYRAQEYFKLNVRWCLSFPSGDPRKGTSLGDVVDCCRMGTDAELQKLADGVERRP